MKKIALNTGISMFPMPAAVISVGIGEEANLITLAYVGKVCLQPPIIAISIQPRRYSFKLIDLCLNSALRLWSDSTVG